jgi:hypothetical protein
MAKTLTARQQFPAEIDGKVVIVLAGARFPIASEIVRRHPEMFEQPRAKTATGKGKPVE